MAAKTTPRALKRNCWTNLQQARTCKENPRLHNARKNHIAVVGGRVARQRANGSRPGGAWEYDASLFWDLWEQLPTLHHTFLQTPPEITSRDVLRYTIKTSDPKISSRMFDLCRNGSPYYTACFGKHILNPHPKIHHQNLRPKDFISHVWLWPEQLSILHRAFRQTHPEPTSQGTPQNLKP